MDTVRSYRLRDHAERENRAAPPRHDLLEQATAHLPCAGCGEPATDLLVVFECDGPAVVCCRLCGACRGGPWEAPWKSGLTFVCLDKALAEVERGLLRRLAEEARRAGSYTPAHRRKRDGR